MNDSIIKAIMMGKNNHKTGAFRIMLLSGLIMVMVLPLGAMGLAFGEIPEEVEQKALEGKNIWYELEELKNKEYKTEQDIEKALELEKQFDEIVELMNEYGFASPEQWEQDPDYWRMKNAPDYVTCQESCSAENLHSDWQSDLYSIIISNEYVKKIISLFNFKIF